MLNVVGEGDRLPTVLVVACSHTEVVSCIKELITPQEEDETLELLW